MCGHRYLLIYPQFGAESYLVSLQLFWDTTTSPDYNSIALDVQTTDSVYILSLAALRYAFLGFSLVSCIVYFVFYVRTKRILRTFEHTMILVLSVSVVLFNDPLNLPALTNPSVPMTVFSTICLTQFFSVLALFMLGLTQKLRYEPDTVKLRRMNPVSFAASVLFFISLTSLIVISSVMTRGAPLFVKQFKLTKKLQNRLQNQRYYIPCRLCCHSWSYFDKLVSCHSQLEKVDF